MKYELAKELKEAGFPYTRRNTISNQIRNGEWELANHLQRVDTTWVEPTLSELIEACGIEFNILQNASDDFGKSAWLANYGRDETEYGKRITNITETGSTPEEAVAKLWIALNKKPESNEIPYYQRDHMHCWQSTEPPCGITNPHRCCLCTLKPPESMG